MQRHRIAPMYSPELQPAERLWPPLDAPLANRTFDLIDEMGSTLFGQCVRLSWQPERIRALDPLSLVARRSRSPVRILNEPSGPGINRLVGNCLAPLDSNGASDALQPSESSYRSWYKMESKHPGGRAQSRKTKVREC